MSLHKAVGAAAIALLTLWTARASGSDAPAGKSGRAAAHEALEQGASLPATPPQLPDQASDKARKALADTAFGKKGDATRRAQADAQQHAIDDARSAHVDAANRAAQASAAAAAQSANADSRAAAGQARATAAKASRRGGPPGRP